MTTDNSSRTNLTLNGYFSGFLSKTMDSKQSNHGEYRATDNTELPTDPTVPVP